MAINWDDPDYRIVLDSNLWNKVSRVVCPAALSQERLLKELVAVKKVADDEDSDCYLHLEHNDVNMAMDWEETPQGYEFWCALHSYFQAVRVG